MTRIMIFTEWCLLACDIIVACNRYLCMDRSMQSSGWLCLDLKTDWTQACSLVLSSTLDSKRKGIIHLAPTCMSYIYCDFSQDCATDVKRSCSQSQRRCSLFMDYYIGLIKCHSMDQSTFSNLESRALDFNISMDDCQSHTAKFDTIFTYISGKNTLTCVYSCRYIVQVILDLLVFKF